MFQPLLCDSFGFDEFLSMSGALSLHFGMVRNKNCPVSTWITHSTDLLKRLAELIITLPFI